MPKFHNTGSKERTLKPSNFTTRFSSPTPHSSSSPSAVSSGLRVILYAPRLTSRYARKRSTSELESRKRATSSLRISRRSSKPNAPTRMSSAPSEIGKRGRRRFGIRRFRFWSTATRTGKSSPVDWIWIFGAARLIRRRGIALGAERQNPRFG